jgi:hypothetical protein
LAPLNLEYTGVVLSEVRRQLIEERKFGVRFVDDLIARRRLAAATFGSSEYAAFLLERRSAGDLPSWALIATKTGYEGIRGAARPFSVNILRKNTASRTTSITIFVESPFDLLGVATAADTRKIYPDFDSVRVVATNQVPYDFLREIVTREAGFSRAVVSGFSRDFHGRTMTGHLIHAIKEGALAINNTGVLSVPWPEGSLRWADAWTRWDEVKEPEARESARNSL